MSNAKELAAQLAHARAEGYMEGFFDCLDEMLRQRTEADLWKETEHLLPEASCPTRTN